MWNSLAGYVMIKLEGAGLERFVDRAMEAVRAAGETPYVIGRIEAGEKGVKLC